MNDQKRPREADRAGHQPPRADLLGKGDLADEQDDEGLDEDNRQSIGDRHHANRGDEAIGRSHEKGGAEGDKRQVAGGQAQRQRHDQEDRQHEDRLNQAAAEDDDAHGHALRGELGGHVDERREDAEGNHQRHAGQDAVGRVHGSRVAIPAREVQSESGLHEALATLQAGASGPPSLRHSARSAAPRPAKPPLGR